MFSVSFIAYIAIYNNSSHVEHKTFMVNKHYFNLVLASLYGMTEYISLRYTNVTIHKI